MAKKHDVHVVPHTDGGWATRKDGAKRAGSRHETQQDAIRRGRDQARQEGAELIIHRRDGRIRDSDSYGPDPHPPKDRKH